MCEEEEEEEATPLTFSNDLCANKDEKGCKIRIFFFTSNCKNVDDCFMTKILSRRWYFKSGIFFQT